MLAEEKIGHNETIEQATPPFLFFSDPSGEASPISLTIENGYSNGVRVLYG